MAHFLVLISIRWRFGNCTVIENAISSSKSLRARNKRSSTPTDSIAMTGWKLFRIVITTIIHGWPGAAAIFQQSPFLIMSHAGRLSKLWAAPSPRADFALLAVLRWRGRIVFLKQSIFCTISSGYLLVCSYHITRLL